MKYKWHDIIFVQKITFSYWIAFQKTLFFPNYFFPLVHSIPVLEKFLSNYPLHPLFFWATLLIFWICLNEVFIHSVFWSILGISKAGIFLACFWTLIFNHIIIGIGDVWDLTIQSPSACQTCCCFPYHLALIFYKTGDLSTNIVLNVVFLHIYLEYLLPQVLCTFHGHLFRWLYL